VDVSEPVRRLLVLCALRIDRASVDWSLIAREALRESSLRTLESGQVVERSKAADEARALLARLTPEVIDDAAARVERELAAAEVVGARLVSVLDDAYPANLRLIPNLPPFLFVRGELLPDDARAVAVVGTRKPSPDGLRRAAHMARLLSESGVTVVSGLATGIDTAAHRAALQAGGRTIAVLGTGITKCYPWENAELAEQITGAGALVSQFWPTTGPATYTFPRRNVVTSGISQGTVVIEASATSGAKMQARLALQHGKRVFLIRTLVTEQPWARGYVERGAIEVAEVGDVISHLAPAERVAQASAQRQLALELL
jgi:DNA processing protein